MEKLKQAKKKMRDYLDKMYVRYLNILRYDSAVTANMEFRTLDTEDELVINVADIFKRVEVADSEDINYEHDNIEYRLDTQLAGNLLNFLGVIEFLNYRYNAYTLKDILVRYEDIFTGNSYVGTLEVAFYRGDTRIDFNEYHIELQDDITQEEGTVILLNEDSMYKDNIIAKKMSVNYMVDHLDLMDLNKNEGLEIVETIRNIHTVKTAGTKGYSEDDEDKLTRIESLQNTLKGVYAPRGETNAPMEEPSSVAESNSVCDLGVQNAVMYVNGREVIIDTDGEYVYVDELPSTHPHFNPVVQEEVYENEQLNTLMELDNALGVQEELETKLGTGQAVSFVQELSKTKKPTRNYVTEIMQDLAPYDTSSELMKFGTLEHMKALEKLRNLGTVSESPEQKELKRLEGYLVEEYKDALNEPEMVSQETNNNSNNNNKTTLQFKVETTGKQVAKDIKSMVSAMLKEGYHMVAFDRPDRVYFDNKIYLLNSERNTLSQIEVQPVK